MNKKMVLYTVGQILRVIAFLMLLPAVVALIYQESCFWSFLITIALALISGTIITLLAKPKNQVIYAKEGFIIVSLAWLVVSLVGALPFYLSGEIPNYTRAFFEMVSGFTTTGASILTDVESMSHGLLFWRSFSHWIGGMGVLVFVMAVFPNITDRSIHIMRAEMPGPIIGKLVPRAKDTAKILYLIYIVMTLVLIVLLVCGGMSLFDSVLHALGTAGTGGFGIKADSVAGYSPYLQWVIAIFMLLFGINFNVYYLLLLRRFRSVSQSTELWWYIGIVAVSSILIVPNIVSTVPSVGDAIRASVFQVSSIITTTGYSTVDFDQWPLFSKNILLILMFIGGCAGSTAGGLKVARLVILLKRIRQEFRHLLHPRSVGVVKFEGKILDNNTLNSVTVYFALYIVLFFSIFLLLCLEPLDMVTTFSATASCFNNVGPALGAAGPMASYACFSDPALWLLSFAMLLGRLEIFPLILLLNPATWSKNK